MDFAMGRQGERELFFQVLVPSVNSLEEVVSCRKRVRILQLGRNDESGPLLREAPRTRCPPLGWGIPTHLQSSGLLSNLRASFPVSPPICPLQTPPPAPPKWMWDLPVPHTQRSHDGGCVRWDSHQETQGDKKIKLQRA